MSIFREEEDVFNIYRGHFIFVVQRLSNKWFDYTKKIRELNRLKIGFYAKQIKCPR